MRVELNKIQRTILKHHRSHSSLSFDAGDSDAIDASLRDARKLVDCGCHFRSRHVFPLPSEGITYPIDKIEVSAFVDAHKITCAKPCVAILKYVTNDFFLGLSFVRVTF